ncbi:hypothetical protein [Tautonia marina]|uniref:hypothetical protein n=1 Tax=Tautonia marina TaxID=2653855 RepID=UPI0012605875|nr:hypothetical protein [Tautonia marina]
MPWPLRDEGRLGAGERLASEGEEWLSWLLASTLRKGFKLPSPLASVKRCGRVVCGSDRSGVPVGTLRPVLGRDALAALIRSRYETFARALVSIAEAVIDQDRPRCMDTC